MKSTMITCIISYTAPLFITGDAQITTVQRNIDAQKIAMKPILF